MGAELLPLYYGHISCCYTAEEVITEVAFSLTSFLLELKFEKSNLIIKAKEVKKSKK